MTVYEIIEAVAATAGKNGKEVILRQHKDNELLKEVFRLAYSPTIQFYIKKIPVPSYTDALSLSLKESLHYLVEISRREITGNAAKAQLSEMLGAMIAHEAELLTRIVLKDLRCGVGDTTIDKIWKGLIPKQPQMLASSMKEKSLAKIRYPAVAELKSDGSRCFAYCSTEGVQLMSRNGKQYQGLTKLEPALQNKWFDGMVLDGELVFDTTKADRSTGNGIITKAVKGTISEEEQSNVIFQVWDVIPQKDYVVKGVVRIPQHERYSRLKELLEFADEDCVQLIPSHEVNSLDEAKEIFRSYIEQGFEGIILKNKDGFWEDNRSPDLVKFKEELFADLKVVGYYEGEGKASGMLGGLSLESGDGIVKVNVGSGFADTEREHLWNKREDLVGEIVEVKYNGITEDKRTGQKSLFLPIFQQTRPDKSEANMWNEMQ